MIQARIVAYDPSKGWSALLDLTDLTMTLAVGYLRASRATTDYIVRTIAIAFEVHFLVYVYHWDDVSHIESFMLTSPMIYDNCIHFVSGLIIIELLLLSTSSLAAGGP